jgi:deferrochelatase/peroxidase EfeB
MAQDLCRTYQSLNIDGDWVAAKMVGRWQDGSSLVRYPDPLPKKAAATAAACGKAQDADDRPREPDNDYWFGIDDPQGLRCPYGSHVRRVNPRDSFQPGSKEQLEISNRHRILRVGRPYAQGEDGGGKAKGLLFMCLNADIERQFEFIQQTWVVSSAFHGLQHEVDPIVVGSRPNGGSNFTIPTTAGPMQLKGLNSYVTVRGGGYFFMPSRSALRYLAMSREK